MSKANYKNCLAVTLKWEGGYSNHPADPGGATMRGVIQTVYDKWRKIWNKPTQPVKLITEDELQEIYKKDYWDKVKGDKLKPGVDLVSFDGGVNSGVARNGQWTRKVLGYNPVVQVVTDKEIEAVNKVDPVVFVKKYCDYRMSFLRGLKTFNVFGKGWTNRVADVRANALAMASKGNPEVLREDATQQQKKAAVEASKAIKTATGGISTSGVTVAAGSQTTFDWTPILSFGGVILLVAVAAGVFFYIKNRDLNTVANALNAKALELETKNA